MKIKLRTAPKEAFKEIKVDNGLTLEAIYKSMEKDLPYTVIAAKMDNKLVDLTQSPSEGSVVEFLDVRTQSASLIYQYGLTLLFLRAVDELLGHGNVYIDSSLNKGLYAWMENEVEVTQAKLKKIEKRMKELVKADLPFNQEIVSRETAIKYLEEEERWERIRLIESVPELDRIKFFSLDGYKDFYYSFMAPSSGYIKYFELKKYRKGVLIRFPHASDPNTVPPFEDEKKLFEAFKEQGEWEELLGVRYVADLNDKIASGKHKELIALSEALHEKKIAQIADMIKKRHKRMVLIAGPSSSGKTTFARRLCIQLAVNGLNPMYLGTDDYFVERDETPLDEHGDKDYENLGALDIKLFNDNMNALLRGEEVDLPTFNFMTGSKEFGKRITKISVDQPLVIEGIHGLNEELTKFIPHDEKFKIYISPLSQLNIDNHNRISTTDERMLRRMVRDYKYRGYSAKDTIRNWPNVRAGENKNIFPYSGEADVLFNSYHVYEISVLKKYAEPLLAEITPKDEEYPDAFRMLQFLKFFRTIEDDSAIVNNSIVREFIGGSVFVD